MDDLLKKAQENSSKATKGKEDYAQTVFNVIDNIILRASEYKDVTGIFLAQIASRVFQAMYRETNSPLDREYDFTHGSDIVIVSFVAKDTVKAPVSLKFLVVLCSDKVIVTSS